MRCEPIPLKSTYSALYAEHGVKAPHILLASGNPQKLVKNIEHLISQRAVNALHQEIRRNVVGLFRLGEEHFSFASATPHTQWRQIISRTYYGAYNVARSVRLHHAGIYSTDSSDHKKIGELPSVFPNRNTYSNRLSVLRDDRNLCDYDHAAGENELVITVPDALTLVRGFIADARSYLRQTGVRP